MLDIKIKPSYESLDFGKITINLVRNSPIFKAEITQSYISYNFTILTTATNRRLLKIPNIIESSDQFENFKADIIINRGKEIEADLFIQEANSEHIKLQLKAVDFDASFLDAKLSSFNFGDDIDIGPNTSDVFVAAKTANTKAYPDTNYVFPMVFNDKFYGTDNVEYLNVINNYDIVAANFVANTNTPVKNKNVLIPYFFLVYLLKQLFETNGVTLKGDFVDNTEIQKIIIHNNFALDQFDITKTFVRASLISDLSLPIFNTYQQIIFQDDSTFPNEDTGGNYDVTLGEFTIPNEGVLGCKLFNLTVTNYGHYNYSGIDKQLIWVSLYIDGVIRGEWFSSLKENETKSWVEITLSGSAIPVNYGWYFDPEAKININTSDVGKKMVIKAKTMYTDSAPNPVAIIHTGAIMEINLDNWSEFNVFSKTITPNNHLPNIDAKKFVNAFIKGFKLMPYFDKVKKELYLNFFDNLKTSIAYDDISDNIISNSIKAFENKGFSVNYDFSSDTLKPKVTPDVSKFQYIGEYDTPASLPTPASVSLLAFVKSVNAYYISKITTGITFERYKENFEDFLINDGSNKYLIDYSPIIMSNETIDNDGAATMKEFLLPKLSETGSSLFYKIGINDPLFKVMLWHGMVDGPTATKPYPFASSYNIDYNGNNIGGLSLMLSNDSDSVYAQYLHSYFNFLLNTKKVEHLYTTNLPNPLSYNFYEKKLIINQRFLTGKLKLKITSKGFESIVAENYKV